MADDRTVAGGEAIENSVQTLDGKGIGQGLRPGEVRDAGKGIVHLRKGDGGPLELARQPVVAVAVELETEGRPGGRAQIAQAELGFGFAELGEQPTIEIERVDP